MQKKKQTGTGDVGSCLRGHYWKCALDTFRDDHILAFAGLILALRIVVKMFKIQLAPGLSLTLDCYVNVIGSVVYGPVMALVLGAASDTLGYILFPSGDYFLPFMFVEMLSGFIFALCFWRRRITILRGVAARFLVTFICNIVLTSLFMKWSYYVFYGDEKAVAYNVINFVRIAKNMILFPAESVLVLLLLQAVIPILRLSGFRHVYPIDLKLEQLKQGWKKGCRGVTALLRACGLKKVPPLDEKLEKLYFLPLVLLSILMIAGAVALIVWYVNGGANLIKANNFKAL